MTPIGDRPAPENVPGCWGSCADWLVCYVMMGWLWSVCRDVGSCWLIVVLVVGSCRGPFMSMVGGMPWLSVVGYEDTRDNLVSLKRAIS